MKCAGRNGTVRTESSLSVLSRCHWLPGCSDHRRGVDSLHDDHPPHGRDRCAIRRARRRPTATSQAGCEPGGGHVEVVFTFISYCGSASATFNEDLSAWDVSSVTT